MLRFSANLGFLWPDRPLLDRIDAAANAGFKAIELHWPYDVPAGDVGKRCQEHGLVLLGINTVRGNVAAGEFGLGALAGREQEFLASVDQAIDFCVKAGGSAIHCMAGIVPIEARATARSVFVQNLKTASVKAFEHGLTLLLEPLNPHDVPGYFYSTAGEGVSVLQEADCANIKLMFDCYHVGMSGGDVIAELKQFQPFIGHVQIASVPGRVEPDQGTLDYKAVLAAVDHQSYEGWTGCEYKPAASTDAGLAWTTALGVSL